MGATHETHRDVSARSQRDAKWIIPLSHLHKEDGDAEQKRGDPGAQDDLARLANGAGVLGPHWVHDCVVPAKSDNSNHSCRRNTDQKER